MNIIKKSSIVTLLSIFAFSAFVTLPAKAAVNPFADHNIMTIVDHDEKKGNGEGKKAMKKGKCGEGKCGEGKKAMKKGKCGEGKCGEGKKAMKKGKCGEGKCGEGKKAAKKGKCGEGKAKAKKCGG